MFMCLRWYPCCPWFYDFSIKVSFCCDGVVYLLFQFYYTVLTIHYLYIQVGKWVPRTFGHKTEMNIEMNDITWPGNSKSPPKGKPDRRYFRIVTFKEDHYVKYRELNEDGRCGHHEVPCRLVYDFFKQYVYTIYIIKNNCWTH